MGKRRDEEQRRGTGEEKGGGEEQGAQEQGGEKEAGVCQFFRPGTDGQAGGAESNPVPAPSRDQWLSVEPQGPDSVPHAQLGGATHPQQLELKSDENAGLCMNIQGLYPMSNRTKVAYLSDLAAESVAPFIALTETHLTAEILSAEIQITGYTLYRSDRQGGRSHGGCGVYCRDDLTVRELEKYSNNFCESQVIEIKELDLILVNVYRSPNSPM